MDGKNQEPFSEKILEAGASKLDIAVEITKELLASPYLLNIIQGQFSLNTMIGGDLPAKFIAKKAIEITEYLIEKCEEEK